MTEITPPVEESLGAPRVEFARRMIRALLVVLGIAVACGAIALVALNDQIADMLLKVQKKLDPPDIYLLAAHTQRGMAVEQQLRAAPDSAEAWLEAARYELSDNNPIGAAWTLGEAKALGAPAEEVALLEGEITIARKRWDSLYAQVLISGRLFDANNQYDDVYRLLDEWRATESEHPLTGKPRADYDLLKAHLLLREGRREEARHILEALRAQPWALQGFANYLYAKTWLREPDPAPAIAAFEEYLAAYPGERLNRYALMELGTLALESGDSEQARRSFTRLIDLDPAHPKAAEARLALHDLDAGVAPAPLKPSVLTPEQTDLLSLGSEETIGEVSEPKEGPPTLTPPPAIDAPVAATPDEPVVQAAFTLEPALIPTSAAGWDAYGTIFTSGPSATAIMDRAWTLYNLIAKEGSPSASALTTLSGPAALGWAEALAEGGRPQAALAIARRGLNGPCDGPTRVALAQLHGRLRLTLGEAKVAEKGMLEDRNKVPAGTDMSALDYELARAYRKQGQNAKARDWYLKASASTDAKLAADARAQAAWAASQMGRWDDALADYQWIVAKHPGSIEAEIARDHLLTDAISDGRTADAKNLAAQLQTATRGQRAAKGKYFSLRLDGAGIDAWYDFYSEQPFSIYGVYAAGRARESHRTYAIDSRVSVEEYAGWRAFADSPAGAAFLIGLWDIAEADWEFAPTPEDPMAALGGVLLEVAHGDHIRTILDSQNFFDHGWQSRVPLAWTDALLAAAYPLDFLPEIETQAAKFQVPVPVVLGIIRQETYFNPRAVSGAGARGLMQLMPATATWAARQVGVPKPSPEDLFKPEINLPLAIWHIQFLEQELGDGFGLVLAAHNGGIGNVRKWQERFPVWKSDPELFTELIPNRETRDFIKVVRTNQAVYEYLLAHQDRSVPF